MNTLLKSLVLGTVFFCPAWASGQQKLPTQLNWETFDTFRDQILPKEKEVGWREIPWRSDFGLVVAEATKKEMPILIWAMNGDPLGCT